MWSKYVCIAVSLLCSLLFSALDLISLLRGKSYEWQFSHTWLAYCTRVHAVLFNYPRYKATALQDKPHNNVSQQFIGTWTRLSYFKSTSSSSQEPTHSRAMGSLVPVRRSDTSKFLPSRIFTVILVRFAIGSVSVARQNVAGLTCRPRSLQHHIDRIRVRKRIHTWHTDQR